MENNNPAKIILIELVLVVFATLIIGSFDGFIGVNYLITFGALSWVIGLVNLILIIILAISNLKKYKPTVIGLCISLFLFIITGYFSFSNVIFSR